MKTITAILTVILLSGCTSGNEFGKCVGAFDRKDPKLEYKVSIRNAFVGILFSSLILPPIFVIVDETFCPVGTAQ